MYIYKRKTYMFKTYTLRDTSTFQILPESEKNSEIYVKKKKTEKKTKKSPLPPTAHEPTMPW
jgi:hypothetical protein